MQRVFVVDTNLRPLGPCQPGRARLLLCNGKAAVWRQYPFTIILKHEVEGAVPETELRIKPVSKITGIALIGKFQRGDVVACADDIHHRGKAIRKALTSRSAIRRGRRNRNTRYRQPRFKNRTRSKGWLPPSIQSRVYNVETWVKKIVRLAPVGSIAIETSSFDTQKLQNPEISGVEYQQGTLAGYEVKEYLLEKWGRKCAYCEKKDVPLQLDHIKPRSPKYGAGGSDRISNLTLACPDCNQKKGNLPVEVFLADRPDVLRQIRAQVKAPLRDAAAINATRYAIGRVIKALGLPTSFWSGGRTKFNRTSQGYPKAHWIDAACVGENGGNVIIPPAMTPLCVKACGHGSRQMCSVDRFGFPRSKAKGARVVKGFRTGDIVQAIVPTGKKAGKHTGRVSIRSRGYFNINAATGTVTDISYKHCAVLHRADGYNYQITEKETALLPMAEARGPRAAIAWWE